MDSVKTDLRGRIGTIEDAVEVLLAGGVIAYPTESCFGLGCDPQNNHAIKRILEMKKRARNKGVILIADRFTRFHQYLAPLSQEIEKKLDQSWPGPNTWLCPAKPSVSPWLKGDHPNLAVRVTAHRPAAKIAQAAEMAVVSTSANVATRPALRSATAVSRAFGSQVDLIVDQSIGVDTQPSHIRYALTDEVVR